MELKGQSMGEKRKSCDIHHRIVDFFCFQKVVIDFRRCLYSISLSFIYFVCQIIANK
jgi:hypothetical protein